MKSTCYFCHNFIKLEFSRQILKNTQILNLVKVHQRGAMMRLIVAFQIYASMTGQQRRLWY